MMMMTTMTVCAFIGKNTWKGKAKRSSLNIKVNTWAFCFTNGWLKYWKCRSFRKVSTFCYSRGNLCEWEFTFNVMLGLSWKVLKCTHLICTSKTCLDLTSPLPENELNGPVLDVNESIILSEFILFYLETNDIQLENVCNWCRNRFMIIFEICVRNQCVRKEIVRNIFVRNCLVLMYSEALIILLGWVDLINQYHNLIITKKSKRCSC